MVNIKIKKFFFVFNYLIFIIILIGSNSIITKSEGIKTSLDLMPVETNINVIEFSVLKFHSNEFLFETIGSNEILKFQNLIKWLLELNLSDRNLI